MRKILLVCCVLALMFLLESCDSSEGELNTNSKDKLGITDTLSAEHFDFTILSATKHEVLTNQLGVEYAAAEGNVLVLIVFGATNTTNETMNVMYSGFNSYADGKKTSVQPVVGEITGYMPLVGAVSAGKTFEGYAVWEVPTDSKELEFSYLDALTGSESDAYLISLDEGWD